MDEWGTLSPGVNGLRPAEVVTMVRSNENEAKAIRELMLELDSARGRVPSLPIALWQNATTAFAAIAVLLVALTYLLGVAGLIWLSLDYGISHARLLSVVDLGGSVGLYVALSVFWLLILLLLIKPIFIWGRADGAPLVLDRREQPDLYEYVHKLCDLLGTPKPERIEVFLDANASASLAGYAWGLFSRRPVLSLGLTLVAGTDIQTFTGILAHELAHFKQGRATRFRLIINAVNAWFARVVYGRDKFDIWVGRASSVAIIGLSLIPVALILLLGRWILWVFMMISHAASGLVSRRGEYEADKYMAAVIGSDHIGPTLQRIAVLSMCLDASRDDMRTSVMTGRLADDIPALASAKADSLSKERQEQILRLLQLEKQTWHSTHPTLLQRTAAAKALAMEPLIQADGPASLLFERFDDLCRSQTHEGYSASLGEELDRIELVPTEEIVAVIAAAERANEALVRFYQCEPPLTRPLLPSVKALTQLPDAQAVRSRLADARSRMAEQVPEYHKLLESLAVVQADIAEANLTLRLMGAGLTAGQLGLVNQRATARQVRNHIELMENEERAILRDLEPFETVVRKRLSAAVQLLGDTEISQAMEAGQADDRRAVMQRVVPLDSRINQAMPRVRELAQAAEAMVTMLQLAGRVRDKRKHKRAVSRTAAELQRLLESIHFELRNEVYPFDHAQGEISLGEFMVPRIPQDATDYEQLILSVGDTIDRYQTLVLQCMAVSAETAEEVESAAGFDKAQVPDTPDPFELMLTEAERGGGLRKDAALSERWLWHFASAAIMCFGILISVVGVSSLLPTVNSSVVPRHPYYEPTIVPAAMHDPTQGPAFFDPMRDWRIQHFPGPSDPGFMPPNYNPNSPYYNPYPNQPWLPGYNIPNHPSYNPNHPYNTYQPTYDPHAPNYDDPTKPGYIHRHDPRHPDHPNNRNTPGYNNPNDPNRHNPGYNNPHDPNRNNPNHNQPNRNQPNHHRPSQPTRPSNPRPSRPTPSRPSPSPSPSPPSPGSPF